MAAKPLSALLIYPAEIPLTVISVCIYALGHYMTTSIPVTSNSLAVKKKRFDDNIFIKWSIIKKKKYDPALTIKSYNNIKTKCPPH